MSFSWIAIITWLLVGSLAGSLTGLILKGTKQGYGKWSNFGIGLVGALIGGAIFNVFGIEMGLSKISISMQDILAAFLGAVLFLIGLKVFRSRRTDKSAS